MKFIIKYLSIRLFDLGLWKVGVLVIMVGGLISAYLSFSDLKKAVDFGNAANSFLQKCEVSEDECHKMAKLFIKNTQSQFLPINPIRCVAGYVTVIGLLDSISTGEIQDFEAVDVSVEQSVELDRRRDRRMHLVDKIQTIPWYGYCFL
ncbi:MAG: hypothetical protein KGZ83_09840 [Sulfuricella sp.]|nr:hypothetical protein [Sulfuricella sp.]